ncbi:MAG: hypothetical protein MOGMAGMI_00779 [Candidatus Omnitrophica bacterium]|nr:hypothetical protein [Candidatus Omnitrophota bacterium]
MRKLISAVFAIALVIVAAQAAHASDCCGSGGSCCATQEACCA